MLCPCRKDSCTRRQYRMHHMVRRRRYSGWNLWLQTQSSNTLPTAEVPTLSVPTYTPCPKGFQALLQDFIESLASLGSSRIQCWMVHGCISSKAAYRRQRFATSPHITRLSLKKGLFAVQRTLRTPHRAKSFEKFFHRLNDTTDLGQDRTRLQTLLEFEACTVVVLVSIDCKWSSRPWGGQEPTYDIILQFPK